MCRSAAVSLLLAAFLFAWTAPAHACKCAEPAGASEALASAGAVFEGRVEKLTPAGNELVVEFSVTRGWKNAGTERLRVRTASASAACGYPFDTGEIYVVYTEAGAAEGLRVSRCSRTRLAAEGEADIAEIGMGVVPFNPSPHPLAKQSEGPVGAQQQKPAAGGCASCSVGMQRGPRVPALAWLAGLVGMAWVRRRRA
jgi:MYXO-CTERM domain-containing protein